jgi:serine/threonine-protein kinase
VASFLLTGQSPFVRERPIQMIVAHLYEPVLPLADSRSEAPSDLQGIVLRCLEKDSARRFPDAGALHDALVACGCAGGWSEDLAADWWRTQVRRGMNNAGDIGNENHR